MIRMRMRQLEYANVPLHFYNASANIFDKVTWPRFERVARENGGSISGKYYGVIKRGQPVPRYVSAFRDVTSNLLEYLKEGKFDEWVKKEEELFINQFNPPMVSKLKKELKKLEKNQRVFDNTLQELEKVLMQRSDLTPLNYHLIKFLSFFSLSLDADIELLKKETPEKYRELVIDSFEIFPEKILIPLTPIISFHIAIAGINLAEKAYLNEAYSRLMFRMVSSAPGLRNILLNQLPTFSDKDFLATKLVVR